MKKDKRTMKTEDTLRHVDIDMEEFMIPTNEWYRAPHKVQRIAQDLTSQGISAGIGFHQTLDGWYVLMSQGQGPALAWREGWDAPSEAEEQPKEYVAKAAIRFKADTPNGEQEIVVTAERPGRHHNIIHALAALGMKTPIGGDQAFVTSQGRFVDREEAAQLAIAAEQIKEEDLVAPPDLYSEDVW
jgi:hypothetical protein